MLRIYEKTLALKAQSFDQRSDFKDLDVNEGTIKEIFGKYLGTTDSPALSLLNL